MLVYVKKKMVSILKTRPLTIEQINGLVQQEIQFSLALEGNISVPKREQPGNKDK